MSRSAYLYRVSAIKEDLPESIDLDDVVFDHYHVEDDRAMDWEKNIGQKRRVFYQTVDVFDVCKKLYQVRPFCVSYILDNVVFKDKYNKVIGEITRDDLATYYYTNEDMAYLYDREQISVVENIYFLNIKSGLLSEDKLFELLQSCVDQEPDYGFVCLNALLALLKAYFIVRDGGMVCCDID